MNYYQHHIGDYRRDTAHLSLLEHGVYRQLMDMYYLSETKIPEETEVVYRRLCAKTNEEKKAVDTVLSEFFKRENGWIQTRCDMEIKAYHSKAERARVNGKLGGRPVKTKEVISGLSKITEEKANHKPLTINHKPLSDTKKKRASRLPDDFWTNEVGMAALIIREDWSNADVLEEFQCFKDYWISQPGQKGVKEDWLATWRNWCRRSNRKGSIQ